MSLKVIILIFKTQLSLIPPVTHHWKHNEIIGIFLKHYLAQAGLKPSLALSSSSTLILHVCTKTPADFVLMQDL